MFTDQNQAAMCRFNDEGSRQENGYDGTHMGQNLIVEFGPYVQEPTITDIEIMRKIVEMRVKRQKRVPPTDYAETMHYHRLAFEHAYGFLPILNPEAYEEHELVTEEEFFFEAQIERQPVEEHVWLVHQREEVLGEVTDQQEDVIEDQQQIDEELDENDINIQQNVMDRDDEARGQADADITPDGLALKRGRE